MSREAFDRLVDIEEALERVLRLTRGVTFEEFLADEATYFAVIYSLGVVGEAAKSLPVEIRSKAKDVDWRAIGRLRDILFHVYFGISDKVIWQIVTVSAPATLAEVKKLASELNPQGE